MKLFLIFLFDTTCSDTVCDSLEYSSSSRDHCHVGIELPSNLGATKEVQLQSWGTTGVRLTSSFIASRFTDSYW